MINVIPGPSVKKMESDLKLGHAEAVLLKALMDGRANSEKAAHELGITPKYNSRVQNILEIANKLMNEFGVEYIAHREDSHRGAFGLEYVNTGDTYKTTLIYNLESGRFLISSWGDIVERNQKKYP